MTAHSFDADALTHLESLPREELGERFEDLFGRDVPKRMSRPILIRAVAYRLQENAHGGPNRALMRRLNKMARELQDTGAITSVPPVQIKPGTRFLRDWQGDTYRVTVTEGGFLYRNQTYKSLSAIARQITGTRWSGPAFFGLKNGNGQREAGNGR